MNRVYFIHLESPLGNNRHQASWYVGWAKDDMTMERRVRQHFAGRGSSFTKAAVERGISMRFMGYIVGTRQTERDIKNYKATERKFEILDRRGEIVRPSWLRAQ